MHGVSIIAGLQFGLPFEASGDHVLATPLLLAHVLAGVIALLSGIVAVATVKGGRRHNRAGKLYGGTMGFVVITAFPLAAWAENWFLFAVAIFAGYLVGAGYRVVTRRRAGLVEPTIVDYLLHGTMVVTGVAMIAGGTYAIVADLAVFGEVLLVFGLIGGLLAVREFRQFRSDPGDGTPWFERHVAFMGGGYIATVTAAVTVNLAMVPELVRWLGPTVVGVPLIFYAIRKYRPRFGGRPA